MTEQQRNYQQCRKVAETLEAYAEGIVYRDESGDTHTLQDGETAPDEWEQLGLLDYIGDALDIRYTVDREFDYVSGWLLVAYGGPSIWVDTLTKYVYLSWWGDKASYPLSDYASDALDDCMRECYECMR